jgi:hypothetical protein
LGNAGKAGHHNCKINTTAGVRHAVAADVYGSREVASGLIAGAQVP